MLKLWCCWIKAAVWKFNKLNFCHLAYTYFGNQRLRSSLYHTHCNSFYLTHGKAALEISLVPWTHRVVIKSSVGKLDSLWFWKLSVRSMGIEAWLELAHSLLGGLHSPLLTKYPAYVIIIYCTFPLLSSHTKIWILQYNALPFLTMIEKAYNKTKQKNIKHQKKHCTLKALQVHLKVLHSHSSYSMQIFIRAESNMKIENSDTLICLFTYVYIYIERCSSQSHIIKD